MNAPLLRTDRTVLIPLGAADLDEAGALYADETVMEYLDGGVRSREQTKSMLGANERCWRSEGWGLWAIRDAATGGLIGAAGLQRVFDVDGAEADFGFAVARRHWDEGYAVEAGDAILHDVWDRFTGDLIHAIVHPDDRANQVVLLKLGFRLAEERTIHGQARQLWEIQRTR